MQKMLRAGCHRRWARCSVGASRTCPRHSLPLPCRLMPPSPGKLASPWRGPSGSGPPATPQRPTCLRYTTGIRRCAFKCTLLDVLLDLQGLSKEPSAIRLVMWGLESGRICIGFQQTVPECWLGPAVLEQTGAKQLSDACAACRSPAISLQALPCLTSGGRPRAWPLAGSSMPWTWSAMGSQACPWVAHLPSPASGLGRLTSLCSK